MEIMNKLIEDLRAELVKNSDENTRISGERFFKEKVKLLGLKSATVAAISKEYYKSLPDKGKSFIFTLCEDLFKSGIMEESFIACNWSYYVHKQYDTSDWNIFEKWVKTYLNNWASCDTLCNHTVGTLIEMYPGLMTDLKNWTRSDNRWVKRASAVSLIVPARKGMFLNDVFEIADILLHDSDDMVQKGYGWMLKVASQSHPEEVFNYVMKNKSTMPRTSLRYAIEKLTPEMKKMVMERG
jgi:3-methyladenine DNA glycosylase AlkD